MTDHDASRERIGRRSFLKVAAAGAAGAGLMVTPRVAAAAARSIDPGADEATVGAAAWRQRRVDYGDEASIDVLAPGARDGTWVTAVVYRKMGTFKRLLGSLRTRTRRGRASLAFRCAPIGPVDREGVRHLSFRVHVWDREKRLRSNRDLQVLLTAPRFSM